MANTNQKSSSQEVNRTQANRSERTSGSEKPVSKGQKQTDSSNVASSRRDSDKR